MSEIKNKMAEIILSQPDDAKCQGQYCSSALAVNRNNQLHPAGPVQTGFLPFVYCL